MTTKTLTLPAVVDARRAFLSLLSAIITEDCPALAAVDPETMTKEDFDCDLANAVDEAAVMLGISCPPDHPNPAEWDGELMDWAAEAGWVYPDAED